MDRKKNRKEHGLFIVEGEKMVNELINECETREKCAYRISELFYTLDYKTKFLEDLEELNVEQTEITETELAKISNFSSPNQVLALVNIPQDKVPYYEEDIVLMIDGVIDPGNLGNIIRCADWFGINHVICSTNCVGLYNPKVVQASMGSIFRINVLYTLLPVVLAKMRKNNPLKPIYGATLDGENIYGMNLNENSAIVMGSESHGISEEVKAFLTKEVKIPQLGRGESLNVASATAILCSEFKRFSV
ncbi:RNA methyltransferase [Salibacteraceae bacterium]|nr:RNA methyltransferase [Salibacteraceae bacterium]